jgi:hypothetical protein
VPAAQFWHVETEVALVALEKVEAGHAVHADWPEPE